jgi:hypothetical protein
MRAMTWPTVTVAPSSTSSSVIVPAIGAGSSMSTLSVDSSTTVWPSSTWSPTLTDHSRSVASVTDSPPDGVVMSTTWAGAASAAGALVPLPFPLPAGAGRGRALGRELDQERADLDGVALGRVDLDDGARDGRGDLGVDLVRRDLHEGLVGGDRVALLLVPLEDRALGDRLSHRRERDLNRRRVDRHEVDCGA